MVEIISLLNQSPLFGNLDAVRTQRLAALFSTRLFQPGEVIFSVGDPSETLYLICEGQVDLVADRKRAQEPFCTLHRGDFFGEEALLLDDPRFYQAVAQGDAILLALPVNRYLAIHQDLPEFEDLLEALVASRRLSIKLPQDWLAENEHVQVISRRHPALLWAKLALPLALGVASLLLGILMLWMWLPGRPYGWIVLAAGGMVSFFWSLWVYYNWKNDYFLLTNKRVVSIEKVALTYDNRREAPLRTVMSVGLWRSRMGSAFGFADVIVQTYVGNVRLEGLPNADALAMLIEAYWHKAEDWNRRDEAEAMTLKLHQKLDPPESPAAKQMPGDTQPVFTASQVEDKEPGFFGWLFADFLRLRYESDGTITYRKHWFMLVKMTLLPVLLSILAVVAFAFRLAGRLAFLPMNATVVGLIVVFFLMLVWFLYQYADWRNDVFQVTQDQIVDMDRKPLGKVRRRSAPLENVLSIEYERQGFWGYIFNFGTVYISVGNTELTFDFVYNPSEVQRDIFYRMGERQDEIRQREIDDERERFSDWLATYDHRRTEDRDDDFAPPSSWEDE